MQAQQRTSRHGPSFEFDQLIANELDVDKSTAKWQPRLV